MSIQDVNVDSPELPGHPPSTGKPRGAPVGNFSQCFLVLFFENQNLMGNLIDVWFPFWKIYIKQTSQTKNLSSKNDKPRGFSLFTLWFTRCLVGAAYDSTFSIPCRWFLKWLPFHGYGKILLSCCFLGSRPTKKQKYVYKYIYRHNISKCLALTLTSRYVFGECDFVEICCLLALFHLSQASLKCMGCGVIRTQQT